MKKPNSWPREDWWHSRNPFEVFTGMFRDYYIPAIGAYGDAVKDKPAMTMKTYLEEISGVSSEEATAVIGSFFIGAIIILFLLVKLFK